MATHSDKDIYKERITTGLPTTALGNLLTPGQAGGGIPPLLMDTLPANYAYSSMLVLSTYTGPLIRVREAGGDTEADIYALAAPDAAGNYTVDTAAIASHCGANVGYVTKIYDQMGSGVDLVQTNAFRQRRIYSGSAVYTSGTNNVPAFENYNVGSSFGHYTWQGSGNLSTPLTIYMAHHADVSDNDYHFYGAGTGFLRAFLTTSPDIRLTGGATLTANENWVTLALFEYIANNASSSIRINAQTPTTGTIGLSNAWDDTTYIWAKDTGADYVIGTTLEMFIYQSAIGTTDSATIRADRNAKIGIY